MACIRKLPDILISQIAAGEVIERPAYAVKELIENSIDASATSIEIHIEDGGLQKIQVIDNGYGMSKEDLLLSYQLHTTSKLNHDEISNIRTLGFRGEALASLAAVSRLSIKSRTTDMPGGQEIGIDAGELIDASPIGMPIGTIITTERLFSNVPARKKFLKSTLTEFRHISDVVMHAALAHPKIRFLLSHNRKQVFDLSEKTDIQDRAMYFLGNDLFSHLLPLTFEDSYISLSGYIGKPQTASKLSKQFLFVNKRPITDQIISLAVKEAFGTLLPANHIPVVFLSISLPPEMVDVNVHPRKEHISFSDTKLLFDAVKIAVSETLAENNLTFRMAAFKNETSAKLGETTSFAGDLIKSTLQSEKSALLTSHSSPIQSLKTYILAPTDDGFSVIDQHAAHERVLFEDLKKTFGEEKKKQNAYQLPKPFTLSLALNDTQIIEEYMKTITSLGFLIDHFQGTTFLVREIPIVFKGRRIDKILMDMIADISATGVLKSIDTRTERMLMFLSCRAAVKAGDVLSTDQMKKLIEELDSSPNSTTCPHGRPTRYVLTKTDLEKIFKR